MRLSQEKVAMANVSYARRRWLIGTTGALMLALPAVAQQPAPSKTKATEGGLPATERLMRDSGVLLRILAIYEAGGLVTMCAWCRRVEIDGEWSLAPRQALSAIEARYTLSHSICPTCTLEADQPPASV